MECHCVVPATAWLGHIEWHIKLMEAIMKASNLMSDSEIKAYLGKTRLKLLGSITVVDR